MDTVFENCSHFAVETNGDTTRVLECFTYLSYMAMCLILLGVCSKLGGVRVANKTKCSQPYLKFRDLPAVKTWTPIKLIGNLPELFPMRESAKTALRWSETYGDVFTCIGLGQKFVVLNSGPTIQALMKSGDFGHVTKAPVIYNLMKPFITNGVLVSKGAFWQQERKLIMRTQTFSYLKSYIPMIEKYSRQLVNDLDKLFEDELSHQIIGPISTTFIGIINEVITGKDVSDPKELNHYHYNFSIWKEVMCKRVMNPLLQLKPIWMFHPQYSSYEKALNELSDFAKRRLAEHDSVPSNKYDMDSGNAKTRNMLDELVDAGVNDEQIIDEINTMMFGGHETGASAIHFLCFCLALNPQIQEEAQTEVDKLFEDKRRVKDEVITYESLQTSLKYLERCIFEALRLFPPVFAIGRKLERPLKIEYKGQDVMIPEGVNIIVCPFMLQRRQELYPDPQKFDPNRFTPDECAKRHAYSYIPFSSGQRNCLGQKFAMIELKIITAYILRHFKLSTSDKIEDVKVLPHTTLTPEKSFNFRLKRRCT